MKNIKRYTRAWEKAIVQAQAEAKASGETRIVAETVYGVFVGGKAEFGGMMTGMYRTFVRPSGTWTMEG